MAAVPVPRIFRAFDAFGAKPSSQSLLASHIVTLFAHRAVGRQPVATDFLTSQLLSRDRFLDEEVPHRTYEEPRDYQLAVGVYRGVNQRPRNLRANDEVASP